ncbi:MULTISPECIES: hypothetical protein [unclassified Limnobacter]|jgi:hypothetical protein|uniref:hypothetical protein n=1 Tax=unclassified Limnobacter TaxID=2630203 RepID=UPI001358A147|nr:hypothetical protein [Limnobacter sp. 130]
MMRRIGVHVLLLCALMFQSMAHAMPCCAEMQDTQHAMDSAVHLDEGCFAGSPLCCAVPSLPYVAAVISPQSPSPVYATVEQVLQISFQQSSPERPPRA